MDYAQQQAIGACGCCGWPEDAHQVLAEPGQLDVRPAFGAPAEKPCGHFIVSDAWMTYVKHLNIAATADAATRGPICKRCGGRGHRREVCPL